MSAARKPAWALAAATAATLARCGSAADAPSAAPPSSHPASSSDLAPGSSDAPPSADTPSNTPAASNTGGRICRTSQLDLRTGQVTGAAGTFSIPLVFTNTGPRECTLTGYPGVSYLATPGGTQIGPAAERDGPSHGLVSLGPGDSATARVLTTNVGAIPEQKCGPTPVAGMRVYPPDDDASVFVPFTRFEACSRVGVLRVQAVEAGIHR